MARHWLAAFALVLVVSAAPSLADESEAGSRRPALAAGDSLGLALFPEVASEPVASDSADAKVELAATAAGSAAKK